MILKGEQMKKFWKCLKWIGILGLTACLFVVGVNGWMIFSTRDAIFSPDETALFHSDCILVLGCGVRSDGKPSHMLQDRLDVAIAAYQKGLAPKLLMSGDHGREDYDEVNAMKDYAISKGVPSEDIFMDHAGFSTYESMHRARDIFRCERIIIVTQTYHLYRAIHNAKAFGMEAVGISADLRSYARQTYFDIREAAARVKDWVWCMAKIPPTYLGEEIPIFGNGDATNDRPLPLQERKEAQPSGKDSNMAYGAGEGTLLLDFLHAHILPGHTLDEIMDVFEEMCLLPVKDDLLLCEYGVFDVTGEELFYFDLVRQYPDGAGEYHQIRVRMIFAPDQENKQLQGVLWSDDTEENFFDYIRTSPGYSYVKSRQIKSVEIGREQT